MNKTSLFVVSLLQLFVSHVALTSFFIYHTNLLAHTKVRIPRNTLVTYSGRLYVTKGKVSNPNVQHLTEYQGWNQSKSFVYDKELNVLQEINSNDISSWLKSSIFSTFVPSGDINKEYFSFVGWRTVQRMISSINNVFGTQALLLALGIKRTKLGISAVSSWVIKDALGKLFRVIWAGGFGRRFDCDAKQWRFRAAILYSVGNALEVLTLLFPSYFLVTAALGNALKQVAMLTSSATRSSIYKTFSGYFTDNIGDITAKGEAQIAVIDLFGMFSGVYISKQVNFSKNTILFIFGVLSLLDLFCVYKEIQSVIYRTLNFHRCGEVLPHVLQGGHDVLVKSYLSPEAVAQRERLLRTSSFVMDESLVKTFSSLSSVALQKYLRSGKNVDNNHKLRKSMVVLSLQPIWNISWQEKTFLALGWRRNVWLGVVPCTIDDREIRVPCVFRSEVLLDRSATPVDLFRSIIISCKAALDFTFIYGNSWNSGYFFINFSNTYKNRKDVVSKLDILADELQKVAYKYEEIHIKDILHSLQQLGWSTEFFSLGTMQKRVDL